MGKRKFYRYTDEITGDIIAIEGYAWPAELKARIFVERVLEYPGGPKVTRYYPQIDDDAREYRIILGDVNKGYRFLKDAKAALVKELDAFEANPDAHFQRHLRTGQWKGR